MSTKGALRRIDWGHLALLVLLGGATVWYLLDAWEASAQPRNLILILPASILALVLTAIIAGGVVLGAFARSEDDEGETPRGSRRQDFGPFLLTGLFTLYILTLPVFGFDVGSALFLAMALVADGERRPVFVAAYSLAFAAAATLIFGWLLPYPMHTLVL